MAWNLNVRRINAELWVAVCPHVPELAQR